MDKRTERQRLKMQRILIINVNWLGDTLFVTPFIRAVRENHPKSYIALFTHPRCQEIFKDNPYINEIILYDEKRVHKTLLKKLSIISKLRSKRFDTAFILRRSLSRALLLFLSKIPERIGYDNKKSGFLLTKKIAPPSNNLHRVEYFMGLAKALGMTVRSMDYDFFITKFDEQRLIEILDKVGFKDNEEFIVINPGGNWDLKRWPAKKFALLGDEIFNKFDAKVVLSGAAYDISLCEKIYSLMKHKPVLLCGKTDLKTLGALFKRAKLVISNDSGPMHIAVAVKAPLVTLFGPTSPFITGPYGEAPYKVIHKDVNCKIPCYRLSCKDNRCMKAITVRDVLEKVSL